MGNFINNQAYEASAGSGKAFMLVVRYLSLLFKGAKAKKILALTFIVFFVCFGFIFGSYTLFNNPDVKK